MSEITFALGISAALVVVLPAAELGALANCAETAHSGIEAATINNKIDRYLKLKADLPYQYNILDQQLSNNPNEWHRFMQQQTPFNSRQAQLRRQGSTMKRPVGCHKRPQSRVPPQCQGFLNQAGSLPPGSLGQRQLTCMYQKCIANGGQIPSWDYNQCDRG